MAYTINCDDMDYRTAQGSFENDQGDEGRGGGMVKTKNVRADLEV